MADDVATRFQEAVQYRINGEYDSAVNLFKSVIAEQPNNADAYHELGLVFSFLVTDDCLPTLAYACKLAPHNLVFIMSYGKALAMFGEFERAKQMFQMVLKADPFNDDAQTQLSFLDGF
jgi:tetratricopeptide (TPR) repeat protein